MSETDAATEPQIDTTDTSAEQPAEPPHRDIVSRKPAKPGRRKPKIDTGAARKSVARRADRTIAIGPCEDPALRTALESDTVAWLRYFFQDDGEIEAPFSHPFSGQHLEIIAAIDAAIDVGGDQAIAASRGEGKSTLTERVTLKAVLQGRVRFAAIFGATGPLAANSLEEIKLALETNNRLHALYPEVCVPIRALENIPQRASAMILSGHRHDDGTPFEEAAADFTWTGREVTLPRVPGAPASGATISTRGLDGAVRGLKKKGRRPDIAIIDDPDDEETARSEEQTKKLKKKIDRAIAGLGSQSKPIARVLLTTLQTSTSVSAIFTDPAQKPSWKGKRFKFLAKKPTRLDLWEKFVEMRQEDWKLGTDNAHLFYLANQVAMDDGAEVSNAYRFDPNTQASALEFYFSQVAKLGQEAVSTEYDNEPPVEAASEDIVLTAKRIQKQINGLKRQVIPEGTTHITRGIDCKKQALHWAVRAWLPDGSPHTIDYGVTEVLGTKYGESDGVELALRNAILKGHEEFMAAEYRFADGELATELLEDSLTLIDCRWQREAVVGACRLIGDHTRIMPVMGYGRSKGVRGVFRPGKARTATCKPGQNYNLVLESCTIDGKQIRFWCVQVDADYWKNYEHERWLTGEGKPGRALIWGETDARSIRFGDLSRDQKAHTAYAHHLTNESEVDGVWKTKSDNVHWLDGSCYSDVGYRVLITNIRPVAPAVEPAEAAQVAEAAGTAQPPPRKKSKAERAVYFD